MLTVKYPLSLIAVFIWVGFVCAISFMEAWLKFTAPGINLQLGLGIGRIVFSALNKVEWVLAISIVLNYFIAPKKDFKWSYLFFIAAYSILLIQTFYALPTLDFRAEQHLKGIPVTPSNLHLYYIIMEGVKVISLISFGLKLFK